MRVREWDVRIWRTTSRAAASSTARFASNVLDVCLAEKEERKERRKKGYRRVASNGYSRINPSIMSSASEFPQCGERLEIIKRSAGRRR